MGGSTKKGGKSEQKQKQSQTNMPPLWSQALFQQGANDAMKAYFEGKGGNVYQGDRVADPSVQTQNAVDGLTGVAGHYNDSYLNGLVKNPTASSRNLSDMAAGELIGKNPQFNAALQNTLDNAATTIDSQMSGAGRYGSGAHSGVLANNLGQIATSAMANQYNNDVRNMMNANSQVDAANQSQLAGANNFYQGQGRALKDALLGGRVLDKNAQDKLNANWQKWSETDNRDWIRLGLLQNAADGFSGNYGMTQGVTKTKSEKKPGILDAVGSVGGLVGKSDIRAKENITPIGEKNGFVLYEFNYRGEVGRYRGVMAQDVLKTRPDAVLIDPQDGLYCVDYGAIGLAMERVG